MEFVLPAQTDRVLLVGFGAFFVLLLLALAVTDLRTGRLPNWQNALLFIGGVLFCYSAYGQGPGSALAGTLLGGALLLLVAFTYRSLRKHDGLGGGDVKFVAACGPWVGALGSRR
jgi:Flp pilus assembly protein protease CpaA